MVQGSSSDIKADSTSPYVTSIGSIQSFVSTGIHFILRKIMEEGDLVIYESLDNRI
jgi:hypothetical protein